MTNEQQEPGPLSSADGATRPSALDRFFYAADGRLRPGIRVLLFVAFGFALTIPMQFAVFNLGRGLPQTAQLAVLFGLLNPLWLLATWFFLRAFDRRSFRTVGLWFYPGWGREVARGVGIGAGLIILVVAVLVAARGVAYRGLADLDSSSVLRLVGTGAMMVLAAAFEEIAFRGYAFQRLVDSIGALGAVVVSSGLFGAAHLWNPSATAFSTANTLLAGVLLSVAYLRTRALWLPIGLHWGWNFFLGQVFSLPVSGINFGPTMLRPQLIGAKWLTGGAYGPEGSAALTVWCVVFTVWLAWTRRICVSAAMEEVLK